MGKPRHLGEACIGCMMGSRSCASSLGLAWADDTQPHKAFGSEPN